MIVKRIESAEEFVKAFMEYRAQNSSSQSKRLYKRRNKMPDDSKILQARQEGLSINEIAEKFGVSKGGIQNRLRKYKSEEELNKLPKRIPVEEALRMSEAGMSAVEIGKALDAHPSSIRKVLRKERLKSYNAPQSAQNGPKRDEKHKDDNLYLEQGKGA